MDATRKYDRQLIVALLDRSADPEVEARAASLQGKRRPEPLASEVVTLRPAGAPDAGFAAADVEALRRAAAGTPGGAGPMTGESRAYLVGRGDWRAGTLAGRSAAEVADLLGGLPLAAPKVISIVADELGRDRGAPEGELLADEPDSFASELHRLLRERHGIETVVHARVYRTEVADEALEPGRPERHGRKVTRNERGEIEEFERGHHREHSKLTLRWEDGAQRREWAY